MTVRGRVFYRTEALMYNLVMQAKLVSLIGQPNAGLGTSSKLADIRPIRLASERQRQTKVVQ